MKAVFRWVFFFCAAVACSTVSAQTPRKIVEAFVVAWNRKDVAAAAALVDGGRPHEELTKASGWKWPDVALKDLTEEIEGDSATVSFRITVTGLSNPPQNAIDSVDLVRRGEQWLISLPKDVSAEKRILPMIACIAANPEAILDDIAKRAKEAAKKTACMSNLKQVALAAIMLAGDHDDIFKFNGSNFKTKLARYAKNSLIFSCLMDEKDTRSYAMNDALAGISSERIRDPAMTVLFYEGKHGVLNFRHAGKAGVAFADGHVKMVTKEQAKSLVWKP